MSNSTYGSDLSLVYHFDNIAALGESSSLAKDFSPTAKTGVIT